MNENLFQFIWQHSLFQPSGLFTTAGEPVTIIHPGRRNTHSGPDFEEARIRVGDTILVGNVELHIYASDWNKHGHTDDKAYQNIVLHVVYKNDSPVSTSACATLVLANHIPDYLIGHYSSLLQATHPIACASQLSSVKTIVKESWLNRLLAERWEEKLTDWKELLDQTSGDWRNLLYWRMAANFGFKVNATPFLMLAISLPVNILARHKENLFQIEALLFGQAGMLDKDFNEPYPAKLREEYQYLRGKYQLHPVPVHLWRYMRMRPSNFPTVRIAQFAVLVHRSLHLFARIVEKSIASEILPLLQVTASQYWNTHYRLDEPQERNYAKVLGTASVENLIINTIAPVQFLYAKYHSTGERQQQAIQLLSSLSAETNNITRLWSDAGWKPKDAAASQAQIQLFNRYCNSKRCLSCAIGLAIIKSKPVE